MENEIVVRLQKLQDKAKEVAMSLNELSVVEANEVLRLASKYLNYSKVSLKKEDLVVENAQ